MSGLISTEHRESGVWLMGLQPVEKRLRCGVLFVHGDHFAGIVDLALRKARIVATGQSRLATPTMAGQIVQGILAREESRGVTFLCAT